jgi:truncated hemoglobin YjbI
LTIYERVGGFASVRRVVSAFYDKALESDLIAHHFTSTPGSASPSPSSTRWSSC